MKTKMPAELTEGDLLESDEGPLRVASVTKFLGAVVGIQLEDGSLAFAKPQVPVALADL